MQTLRAGSVSVLVDDDFLLPPHGYLARVASTGYIELRIFTGAVNGRSTYASRLLHRYIMGEPVGLFVDHINRDKLDNRRENLRSLSPSASPLNRSGRGYTYDKRKRQFAVQCMRGRKHLFGGYYRTEAEAVVAALAFQKEVFGSDRYFPEDHSGLGRRTESFAINYANRVRAAGSTN